MSAATRLGIQDVQDVAVIPAGMPHSLEASSNEELEFVIFGTPPMSIDDERAKPVKPVG
jgi:hypothetical protein